MSGKYFFKWSEMQDVEEEKQMRPNAGTVHARSEARTAGRWERQRRRRMLQQLPREKKKSMVIVIYHVVSSRRQTLRSCLRGSNVRSGIQFSRVCQQFGPMLSGGLAARSWGKKQSDTVTGAISRRVHWLLFRTPNPLLQLWCLLPVTVSEAIRVDASCTTAKLPAVYNVKGAPLLPCWLLVQGASKHFFYNKVHQNIVPKTH